MQFEWDPKKAVGNLRKHGVSLEEARTVFGDPLGTTVPDRHRSAYEQLSLTTGLSERGRVVIVWHTEAATRFGSSEPARQALGNGEFMSRVSRKAPEGEMRAEYDIRGGVRGKYYERYRAGTNVVLLEQDVAAVFLDSESVNRALRLLINLAQASAAPDGQTGPPRRSTRPRLRNGSATPKRSSGPGG